VAAPRAARAAVNSGGYQAAHGGGHQGDGRYQAAHGGGNQGGDGHSG